MKYAFSPFFLLAVHFAGTTFALPANAEYATQLGRLDTSVRDTLPRAACHLPSRPTFGKRDLIAIDRQLFGRQDVGSTITVAGEQYKLIKEVSSIGTELTFRAETVPGGTTVYAKRLRKAGSPPYSFKAEIHNTRKVAKALQNDMYISSGSDENNYTWLITAAAPGGEIFFRWDQDRSRFASRAACETDMEDARKVVATQLQKLSTDVHFIPGDNHPNNWYLDIAGSIQNAVPINLGVIRPPFTASGIDHILRDQYNYAKDMWDKFAECGYCKS